MAEIITDQSGKQHQVASNGKANAGLTLGIIGTALGALSGGAATLIGAKSGSSTNSTNNAACMTSEDLYNERKEAADHLDLTKEMYEWRLANLKNLTDAFFDSYQRDVDNSFKLYKSQRDEDDAIKATMNSNFFKMYQLEQDDKSTLKDKINEVEKKVDVMAAIRPYQDALINCKIDKNAILADYNLSRRTCRMIEGQLVLPSEPVVTGFSSYYPTIYTNE